MKNLERTVTEYLINKGLKRSNSGFLYLRTGLLIELNRNNQPIFRNKNFYNDIANELKINKINTIERNIRHCLTSLEIKMYNKEFIANSLDDLRLNMEE